MRTLTRILGIISLLGLILGFIMKSNSVYGADNTIATSLFIFAFVFSPLFLFIRISEETRRTAKISYSIFFMTCIIMMAGTQLSMLHLPGASILNVTSLILFVVYIIFFSNPQEGRKLRLRKDRQLAAILFTDIAGYTKLMAANEDEGLRAMEANRKIHKKWLKKFRGKWLKELGDGVIVIFYTVTEATLCAIEIQKEIKQTQKFSLRMGIHASEIVFTDADAFGDGMNMASRISDQAAGGEICFSDFVFQNIRNREDIKVDVAGLVQLKNVEHPVQLYKIIPAA